MKTAPTAAFCWPRWPACRRDRPPLRCATRPRPQTADGAASSRPTGAAAGLTEQTVYSFENGRNVPRDKTIEAIREALERRGIEFMNGDRPGVRLDRSKAIIPT